MTTTQAAPAAASTPPKTTRGTGYVVLEQDDSGLWSVGATVQAGSVNAAIRKYADKSDKARTLVAVPARSWQPVKVTPKVETKLVISDVKP